VADNTNINIYAIIKSRAQQNPDKILIAVDDESASYREFVNRVGEIAAALEVMGVSAHQNIGLIIPNSVLWYEIFWAVASLGAQPVPLDPQIGEWEMVRLFTLAEIQICFVAAIYRNNLILENILGCRGNLPGLKTIIAVNGPVKCNGILLYDDFMRLARGKTAPAYVYQPVETDPLMLACTSGSTGNPKVIVVPHHGFYQSQDDMAGYLGFRETDIMLLGMPLYHQGGLGMGLQMLLKGGTVIYQRIFEPARFLARIAEKKVTVIQLTATLAKIILSVPDFHGYDLSSVHTCYFAGEALPREVAREFFEKMAIRVVNIIGSSETGTMVVWDSQYDRDVDVNDFRPLPFTRMRILDHDEQETPVGQVGTLYIHTDGLIQEYYQNQRETALRIRYFDGQKWFNTGDLGLRLPGGRMRFVGRAKRIIKRGANLIYPEEIEAFLLTHPDIEAVAVTGEQHALIGEMTVAYIQPRQGLSLTRGDIARFCRGQLANFKIPDRVVITAAIPHDIGKVQFKYIRKNETGGADGGS
jgi:acyl-CoA synthetase (AMP-forming)/AMP-acid ligase II